VEKKKVCIISANCQGAYIKALLGSHSEFSSDFEIFYFVNYKKERIPVELLKKADVLIYQPLSEKWGELSSEYLEEHAPKAFKIRISYLTFPVYWPLFCHDPRNINTDEYPFGQFPYGDRYILDLLRRGMDKEEIFRRVCSKDILNFVDVDKVLEEYIEVQKDIETRRDLKLLDFILDNFRKHKLFETYNHPSKILALHQVNCLLEKLGYRPLKEQEVPNNLDNFLQMFQQPIHPYLAEALKLEFEAGWNTKYKIWYEPMTTLEYYKAYIYWDLTAIGSPKNNSLCQDYKKTLKNKEIKPIQKKVPDIININIYKKNVLGKQIVFIHIPKTGGLSIHKMFSKALFGSYDYKHFNSTIQLMQDPNRRLYPFVSGHFFFDCYKILSKDLLLFTFLRNPIDRTISAFEFMKSHPEVWLGKYAQGTLKEFLSNKFIKDSICNLQTKLLGTFIDFHYYYSQYVNKKLTKEEYFVEINKFSSSVVTQDDFNRAKKNLEKLFFFGFTESLSQDIKKLFNMLGLNCSEILYENRTPEKVRQRDKYSEEDLRLIKELNKFDIELYNYAKELHEKKFRE
jgi:hypothetical protein